MSWDVRISHIECPELEWIYNERIIIYCKMINNECNHKECPYKIE